jgi:uncharacterized protein YdeI (BOF family)
MTKRVQSLWFLSVLALFLSVGISLNAQSTTTPSQTPDSQAQEPTADKPAPPASSQTQSPSQPPSSQTPDQARRPAPDAQAPPAQGQAGDATGVQSFSGTIVKAGDKYMFKDEATATSYDIDHQDEVQKFEGKRVKVKGTLSGNMIHLQ